MACGFSLVHLGLVASSLLLGACSDAGNVFDFGSAVSVLAASGSGQSDTMGVALKLPFVARTIDANGNPAPGATVLWQVTRGGGSISPSSSVTDAAGRANAFLTLGASADTNEAQATIAENNYPAVFVAVGTDAGGADAAATALALVSGDMQMGTAGAALAQPIVVEARDANGQLVADATVTFSVSLGGGSFNPASMNTDANGRAQSFWTLGPGAGTNRGTATVGSVTPVNLTATAN